MQLIYRSGERHEVSELRLKSCADDRKIIHMAPFKLSLLGTIKIFVIMCKLKDIYYLLTEFAFRTVRY